MQPQPKKSNIKISNYFIDIIQNNFQQIQEAYFDTKNIAKEDQSGIKINRDYEINIMKE